MRLKNEGDGDLVLFGHGQLTKTLLRAELIDEIRLLVMPVLAGNGEGLRIEMQPRRLSLVQATALPSGVVILVYGLPAGTSEPS
jgi:dihydrofolate reductase